MGLSSKARAMRIIDLKENQTSEVRLANGSRLGWTVRKVRGRWRLEVDILPDGTRILTQNGKIK